jgi:RimJ/RimL family protein N-acetyltransferase/ADP-ribose pyrophosphatase YjhB (NUDIX family)
MTNVLVVPTGREDVILRQLSTEADDADYFNAVEANREHLSQFGDDTSRNYQTLEDVTNSRINAGSKLRMGIWSGETFVGTVNATPNKNEAAIGYWLDSRYQRHGFATLAAKALGGYMAEQSTRVYAEVVEANKKSVGVLERAGYIHTARRAGQLIFEYNEVPEAGFDMPEAPTFGEEQLKFWDSLSDAQKDFLAAQQMNQYRGGDWIPYPIYRELQYQLPRFTVELALIKPAEEGPQILLIQRPVDDKDIPKEWHVPGVGVSVSDPVRYYEDNDAALDRIMTKEIGGDIQLVRRPTYLETVRRAKNGISEVTAQYYAQALNGQPNHGHYFDMDIALFHPPEAGLIDYHADTLRRVAAHYTSSIKL